MNEFMKILLSLSVSGTLLLLLIWGLKPFYKKRFSQRWQYYIWIIVALRFMLPVTSDVTLVGSLFERINESSLITEKQAGFNVAGKTNTDYSKPVKTPISANPDAKTIQHSSFDIKAYLCFVWFAAALVLFMRNITVYREFTRYVSASNKEVSDINILNLLSDCEEKLNIKVRVRLYQNAMITSPIMTGFFRPCIILPDKELRDNELSHIFTHELIHYKRGDMFYKWLVQIAICVHWFNPFVYLLAKEVNRTCELSCDEAVVSALDDKTKQEYGDMLISFMKADNRYKSSLVSVTLTEGAQQLKERLGAIMELKKRSKTMKLITLLVTCVLCICFGAAGAYAAPSADDTFSNPASDRLTELEMPEQEQSEWGVKENEVSVSEDESYKFWYTQKGYFYDSYIIELGWNAYGDKYSDWRKLIFDSGMKVYFSDSSKNYMADKKALDAVAGLLSYLKNINTYPAIETPFITRIIYAGDKDISALREEFYQDGDISGFSALFSLLNETERKEWYQKIYDADNAAFFSVVIEYMESDLITLYADKAEKDDNISFFSMLSDYMQLDDLKRYAEKFYNDDNISGFAVLLNYMTGEEMQEWLKKARTDKKKDFVTLLSDASASVPTNQKHQNQHESQSNKETMSIVHESAEVLYYEDGSPYIHDIITNNTDKGIIETEYCILAYDEKGSPLKLHWNFTDSSTENSYENLVRTKTGILPGQTEDYHGGWSLYDGGQMENLPKTETGEAAQVVYPLFCLKQVVFEDGTVWNNPDYENWFKAYAGKKAAVTKLQNYYPYKYELKSE